MEASALLLEMVDVHLKVNQVRLKELFFEKIVKRSIQQTVSSSGSATGLPRSDIEVFLYEHLNIRELNESHSILAQVMMSKLQAKIGDDAKG